MHGRQLQVVPFMVLAGILLLAPNPARATDYYWSYYGGQTCSQNNGSSLWRDVYGAHNPSSSDIPITCPATFQKTGTSFHANPISISAVAIDFHDWHSLYHLSCYPYAYGYDTGAIHYGTTHYSCYSPGNHNDCPTLPTNPSWMGDGYLYWGNPFGGSFSGDGRFAVSCQLPRTNSGSDSYILGWQFQT